MDERELRWHKKYLALAEFYAIKNSKDPSSKVGAILVDPVTNTIVGLGYNGFPPGVADTAERLNNRELKYSLVVHAEVNAIIKAGHQARGATLYVWPSFNIPAICNECCKVAITAGVSTIIGYVADSEDERAKRWASSIAISKLLCDEAGIKYIGIPLDA